MVTRNKALDPHVMVVPAGATWPLPVYELALMTAERAFDMCADVELTLVTPEPRFLMHRAILVSAALTLGVIIFAAWRLNEPRLEPGAIDLIELFPEAEKRTVLPNLHTWFDVIEVTMRYPDFGYTVRAERRGGLVVLSVLLDQALDVLAAHSAGSSQDKTVSVSSTHPNFRARFSSVASWRFGAYDDTASATTVVR